MKQVSIQDLKAQLSSLVAEAEAGETLVITRHNEPVAHLSPAGSPHLRRGTNSTGTALTPAMHGGTKGRVFEVLDEDRGNR